MSQEGSASAMEIPVEASGQAYLVQQRGDELHIGRRAGETVLWQDEAVPVADLPAGARAALDAGEGESTELQRSLQAIVEAFVQRGG